MPEAVSHGFRFVQISDPHLTSLRGVRLSDLMNKRLLGYLSWLKRRRKEHQRPVLDALIRDLEDCAPEHLIVTGDLTHIGLPSEFQQAYEWLSGLGSPQQVTVIPGNHEAYAKTGWNQTLARWQPYMASDSTEPQAGSPFPSLRIRGPAAIIGLSSAVPTAPFLATGRIDADQLRQLPSLLDKTRARGLFRILVLHHSPVAGTDKWRKRLTNAAALQQILEHHGAELVLHGHSHRTVWSSLPSLTGPIPVISTPSGSAVGTNPTRRAGYHRYRLETGADDWQLHVETRSYSLEEERFYPGGEHYLTIKKS